MMQFINWTLHKLKIMQQILYFLEKNYNGVFQFDFVSRSYHHRKGY